MVKCGLVTGHHNISSAVYRGCKAKTSVSMPVVEAMGQNLVHTYNVLVQFMLSAFKIYILTTKATRHYSYLDQSYAGMFAFSPWYESQGCG